MRIIQKKISLEQFKSRMPSIVPAYDSNGKTHHFNHLVDLQNQPMVNYGMIPFNVIIQGVGKEEEIQLGKYNKKEVSFAKLTNLFHSLDKLLYRDLNVKCATRNTNLDEENQALYTWLTNHCFPYFILNDYSISNEVLMYWGTNKLSMQEVAYWYPKMQDLQTKCDSNEKKYCCECDEYEKRGGDTMLNALKDWYEDKIQTIVCDKDDYGHDLVYNVQDNDNTVRVKVLSSSTVNITTVAWHTFDIKEPRVKILGNNRYIDYGHLKEINGETKIINPQTIEIIEGVLTIPCLFTNTTYNILVTRKPYLSIPLTLNNSYENLGEMSSLCEEWEVGYEYNKNIDNQENINYNGGVMVYYNGDNWILNDYDKPGYIYSYKFKEMYFGSVDGMTEEELVNYQENGEGETTVSNYGNEQWERYFDYLGKYEMNIAKTYTYKNNVLILDPTPDIMSDRYTISTNNGNGYCIFNKTICPLFLCNYIEFTDGHRYEVFTIPNTQKQYIIIDHKKYFINYKDNCGKIINKYQPSSGLCFYYSNKLYVNDETIYVKGCVTIDGITVGITDNGILCYINESDKNVFNTSLEGKNINNESHGYKIHWDEAVKEFQYFQPYFIYDGYKISGETTSKIEHLIDENHLAIDNLGIKLDGLMPYRHLGDTGYRDYDVTVKTNDWLGIPYVPKFTYGLEKIEGGENLYWGDIIDKVTISYRNTESATTESATTLEELHIIETNLQSNVSGFTNIQCQVEYYIGTIISGTSPNDYQLYSDDTHEYYGVKYVDTFEISHQQFLYHNTDVDAVLVNYWKMIPHTKVYTNETYDVHNIEEQTAYFEFIIQPFTLQYGYIDYSKNPPTFYKINEYEIGEEIEIYGSMKYMRSVVDRNSQMYSAYTYYCVDEMGNKYWAEYSAESTWIIKKTEDDVYSATTTNNFQDDEKGELTDTVYCLKPIKLYILHSQGTFNSHFDNIGDMTVSQVIHRENKLGFATLENINSNIYIDRGVNRVIDFHLRLLEAKSLESLEQIGNGFFKINK